MDQVSRPMLIALAATIALAAVWLVALRPKPAEIADTPAAPVTAVATANGAATTSDAANAKVAAATGGTSAAPAPTAAVPGNAAAPPANAAAAPPANAAAAPAPAPSAADPKAVNKHEAAVVRDIRAGKVVVLLFWNAGGADDVATRGAVRDVERHGGKVAVHVVPIGRVGQYESITEGVTVSQSPTTLVIDKQRRTHSIVGLTEPGELKQAVGDALAGRR